MRNILGGIRLAARYFRLNLASTMEYRASFWSALFGVCVSDSAFIFFWWVAFAQIGGRIGGYDFRDVMFIWAGTAAAFGTSGVLFGNIHRLARLIVTGELDTFLLQPKNLLMNVLCAHTDISAWGDVVYGFTLMALTGQGAMGWLAFLLVLVFGTALMVGTAVVFGSLAFFFGDTDAAGSMAIEFIVNFCIYPEGIYKNVVKVIMYTLIPAGYIVHVPLKIARGGPMWWIPVLICATGAYLTFAVWIFRRGLKRYESGNLIVTRM